MAEIPKGYRITGGRILTCEENAAIIECGVVVVEGDRIAWVGEEKGIPQRYQSTDFQELDATGCSVMPGLADGHMHISFGEAASEEELSLYTPAEYRAIRAAVDAEKVLLAGVTSACDPGGPYRVALAVRNAVAAGLIQGPRMACAGRQITTQQGIGDTLPSWIGVPESSFGVLVKTRDDILQEIRNEVKDGVDVIKVAGSGPSSEESAAFRLEELELIVDEAHRLGRPVTIHARSRQAVEFAAAAGVDWIMHASFMDERGLELVLKKRIPILPAMTLLVNILEANRDTKSRPLDSVKRELEAACGILTKAHKAGATLIAGSETGFAMTPYGEWHAREMELFVEYLGMSDAEALTCMTRNGAIAVPNQRRFIGTLKPGNYADVLIVDGKPDENVRLLQDRKNIKAIIQSGRPITPWRPPDRERTRWAFEKTRIYTSKVYRHQDRIEEPVA